MCYRGPGLDPGDPDAGLRAAQEQEQKWMREDQQAREKEWQAWKDQEPQGPMSDEQYGRQFPPL